MRVIERHRFGAHDIAVTEDMEDDGVVYRVLVDGTPVSDVPLNAPPTFEDVVRLYARANGEANGREG